MLHFLPFLLLRSSLRTLAPPLITARGGIVALGLAHLLATLVCLRRINLAAVASHSYLILFLTSIQHLNTHPVR